ncbi:MAG TPA: four helix bundle protein [Pyrinomonadaceae bacterium]|jgi:four helix bundle protein
MGKIERFEDIECWKKARELTSLVYAARSEGKFARDYGLRDQLRRASVSILSNIAEGFERDGDKEFLQFLALAKGSCGEVRAQLYVALDQHYITDEEFKSLRERAIEISRMISGLMNYLRQSEMRGRKYRET